jgi:hypothetical protein
MTARNPRLLRWTEETEAQHVRALAALECEPLSAAAQPKVTAEGSSRALGPKGLLPRLLGWLGGSGAQIERDGDRPYG